MEKLAQVDMTKLAQDLVKGAGLYDSIAKGVGMLGSLGSGLWKNKGMVAGGVALGAPAAAGSAYIAHNVTKPSFVKSMLGNADYQTQFNEASQDYTNKMLNFRNQNSEFLAGRAADPTQGIFGKARNYLLGSAQLSPEARQMQYDRNMEALRQGNVGGNIFGFGTLGSIHSRAMQAANAINQGGVRTGGAVQRLLGQNEAANYDSVKSWQSRYGDPSRLGKLAPAIPPGGASYSWSPATLNEYNIGRNYTPFAGATHTQG